MKFSRAALSYLKRITEFESLGGEKFARELAKQCLIDTNGKYVNFIQVLVTSRRLRPLDYNKEGTS